MSTTTTTGGITSIVAHYSGEAAITQTSSGSFGDDRTPGLFDPMITEPIDYDAEIAERARTREPLPPVETDLTNTDFGI